MAIECAIDFRNEWGYLYCTVCEDISLIGLMNTRELIEEKKAFEREHYHD